MKSNEILNEKGMIPIRIQNTDGMTFGFELEFLISHEWYTRNDPMSREMAQLSYDEFTDAFEYDDGILNEEFEKWTDEFGNPDSTIEDWFDDIGVEEFVERINAHPNDDYEIYDGMLCNKYQSQIDVYYNLHERLGEEHGIYPVIFSTAKEADKDYEEWHIEPDGSIRGKSDWDYDCEITSPIFRSYNNFTSSINDLFNWIQIEEVGYTNSTCGFHVNIGLPHNSKPDFVKLAVFMGDTYLHKLFGAGRNTYMESFREWFLGANVDIHNTEFDNAVVELNSRIKSIIDKHFIFNPLPYFDGKNYIEFRALGGADYELKYDILIKNINRFIFLIKLACDPSMYRKEYIQKLYTWLDTNPEQERGNLIIRELKTWMNANRCSKFISKIFKNDEYDKTPIGKRNFIDAIITIMRSYDQHDISNKPPYALLFQGARQADITLDDVGEYEALLSKYGSLPMYQSYFDVLKNKLAK